MLVLEINSKNFS